MALPEHLFADSIDGDLFDTRVEDWSRKTPVRRGYRGVADPVDTLSKVKAALRAGPYAWPGGYPLYFVTRDGAALSFDSARAMFHSVADDFLSDASTGWRIERVGVNHEDNDLYCDHSGAKIPAAHVSDEDEDDEPSMAWAAGSNLSGFMPDSEVSHSATWEEARDDLKDQIENAREPYDETSKEYGVFQDVLDALRALTPESEFNVPALGYRWWVERL